MKKKIQILIFLLSNFLGFSLEDDFEENGVCHLEKECSKETTQYGNIKIKPLFINGQPGVSLTKLFL